MFTSTNRVIATSTGVAAALSLLIGCQGVLDGNAPGGPDGMPGPGSTTAGATGVGPGAGGTTGTGVGGSTATAGTGGMAEVIPPGVDPGSKVMHRLNDVEYNYSVQDALGVTQAPADWSMGQGELYGFDNIAELLGMDQKTFGNFFAAAGKLADEVMSTPALKSAFIGCTAGDAACTDTVISQVGLKLFRRPIGQDEVTIYRKVYAGATAAGEPPEAALKHVLRAMLSSAEFLYRIELDADPASLTPHALSAYELASRLSYFITSSGPDSDLLGSAQSAKLLEDGELGAQTERLLAGPKGNRFVTNFAGQWLGIRELGGHAVDVGVFPNWTPAISAAETQEAYLYFTEFARGNQPWNTFLKADINFITPELAGIYGMTAPAAGQVTRVQDTTDHRYGFLGLGAFLTVSSYNHRTAPTLRARRLLDEVMCAPPPQPPAGLVIPPLDGDSGTAEAAQQNIRERLEAHRKNPICANCHATFDAMGMALENFDAIGQYRATYPNGSPIDASGSIDNGPVFTGLDGLTDMLTADPRLMSCVAEKLFIYSLGRGVEDTDKPYLQRVVADWTSGSPVLPALIKGLVLADTFRQRHAEAQ
jgi:hypothetical protein